METPVCILNVFAYKLALTLHVQLPNIETETPPMSNKQKTAIYTAIHHQNIIGWDLFLKGFTSSYWEEVCLLSHSFYSHVDPMWQSKMIHHIISLSKGIRADRNKHIHGSSWLESKIKLRERVQKEVTQVYSSPAYLRKKIKKTTPIPLQIRLQQSTTQLQRGIHRIQHLRQITKYIKTTTPSNQLTLQQAYDKTKYTPIPSDKFPL
jgi:hypothetical protein